jgi:hypothetical protein
MRQSVDQAASITPLAQKLTVTASMELIFLT